MANETFKTASFSSEGIYLFYIRESGEKVFIARFKRAGVKGTGKAGFKKALAGTSVDEYVRKIDGGQSPMHASGLIELVYAEVERRRAAA